MIMRRGLLSNCQHPNTIVGVGDGGMREILSVCLLVAVTAVVDGAWLVLRTMMTPVLPKTNVWADI